MRWAAALPAGAGICLYALGAGAIDGPIGKLSGRAPPEHGRWGRPPGPAGAPQTAEAPQAEEPRPAVLDSLPDALGAGALLTALPPLPRRPLPRALDEPRFRPRFADWSARWARRLDARLAAAADSLWSEARRAPRAPAPETTPLAAEVGAPPAPQPETPPREEPPPRARPAEPGGILPEALSEYADLQMRIQGRLELGGGWSRFRPCDLALRLNCNPSLIPTLKPDLQFGVRVGGTVSERIHVNVDYDNAREFDAANNINVYYQGLEDEILQRLEVGDVSFDLPPSRYLTRAIPAGNFGFRATGQLGPLEFQTIWAQQKGDLGTRTLTLGAGGLGFVQEQKAILDDADYQRGQFFFLFHPRHIRAFPHIDILRLEAQDADPEFQPASTIKVYRYEGAFRGSRQGSVQENTIEAVAVAIDTIATPTGDTSVADTLRGTFRVLEESKDFLVHRSALWIMLRSPVGASEGFAVVYRTATGREVGTFNAESVFAAHVQDSTRPLPVLELLKDVNHRPGEATWEREMHNVYRVSGGSGVDASSVALVISQGDVALDQTFQLAPSGTPINYLKIFGLDDEPSDERIDRAHIFQPTVEETSTGEGGPTGTYIVFPTLRPFVEPPPLQGVVSDPPLEGRPFPLEPGDRNTTIYEDPLDVRREGTNLYRLTLDYRTRSEGLVSTFNVGALGIREGSERISVGGAQLQRGADYDIDYATGRVDLREPDKWFAGGASQIQVSYEQKPLFQLAPTSVFGFNARTQFGRAGQLNFVGLAQTEKSLQTRPELGLEPSAIKLAGVSGRFQWESARLTRLVDALPFVSAEQGSSISLEGELATSLPTTNTFGTTYVEDFEGGTGFNLFLAGRAWVHGSAPATAAGAGSRLPPSLDETSYAPLVWQDQWLDGSGRVVGPLAPQQIDDELLIQGRVTQEPVLYFIMAPPDAGGRGWRSLTTVISPTGRDFTSLEFLEFYVGVDDALADSLTLVFDLGTVSEDALVLDSLGTPSGLGRLDQEANRTTQIWSNADDVGLWGVGCTAEPNVIAYPFGDPRANCTRNNGLNDTEDLNGDNQLQTDERYFRYTVNVGDLAGPYYVRDARVYAQDAAGNPVARFRLFRIPLRRPDHVEGASFAEFQNIRHLRVTFSSGASTPFFGILARMQFLGSRWLKRGERGVVRGIADTLSSLNPASLVEVGPISTLDPNYTPPPGIGDQLANRTDSFGTTGTQFNEQSLRVRFKELEPGERAEVYLQYPQTPRDLLAYRALRLWALGWEGAWGPSGDLRFFVKLGEDGGSFYLYRTALPGVPPGASGEELLDAWRPEIVLDFERWIALRTAAEDTILRSGGLPGGVPLVLWDADVFPDGDSTYAVVISQRSRPPNLAGIRQISLGVYNAGGSSVSSGELWVDDLRLDQAVDNVGLAGQLNLNVRASDVFDLRASYEGQNPYFRQLGDLPGFQTGRNLNVGGTMRLGRFLPTVWAIDMPLSISYRNGGTDPFFLPRTDIRGEGLRDLRTPQNAGWRADLSLRRSSRTAPTPFAGWLVDRMSLRLSWSSDRSQGQRSLSEGRRVSASLGYQTEIAEVSVPLLPPLLKPVFFFLPDRVRDTRLRLTPRALSFGADLTDATTETRRFESILRLPGDTAVTPVRTFTHALRHGTTLQLQPFSSLDGWLSFNQERDLVSSDRVATGATARGLIDAERSSLLGLGIGWEMQRNLGLSLNYRPMIAPWFTPSASLATSFGTRRNPSYLGEEAPGDTVLQRDFDNTRRLQAGAQLNPQALARAVTGDRGGILGALRGAARWLDIVQLNWTGVAASDFRRQTADPGLGYQLALGSAESFRVVGGDTATRVITSESWSAGSGVLLPLGAVLSADYRVSEASGWTPRSQNEAETVEWPSLQFNWSRMPIPSFLRGAVRNLSLRVGYTERETQERNLGADQIRFREETRIPASVNVGLAVGWQISYSFERSRSLSVDPAGRTDGERIGQGLRLTAQMRPPASWQSLRNPIRINLGYRRDSTDQCRALGVSVIGGETPETCAPFTDLTVQSIDATVDTDVQPFTLGLQASWRDQQSEIGQRPGSSQLNISLLGRFLFQSGPIR